MTDLTTLTDAALAEELERRKEYRAKAEHMLNWRELRLAEVQTEIERREGRDVT